MGRTTRSCQGVGRAGCSKGRGSIEHALNVGHPNQLQLWHYVANKVESCFLILSLCMPQNILFSEQKGFALPPCHPPATGALHGMANTSTIQMMMDPNCIATFHLCLFFFSLFLLCLFDVFLKVTFYYCNFGIFWFTMSQCIKTHHPNSSAIL